MWIPIEIKDFSITDGRPYNIVIMNSKLRNRQDTITIDYYRYRKNIANNIEQWTDGELFELNDKHKFILVGETEEKYILLHDSRIFTHFKDKYNPFGDNKQILNAIIEEDNEKIIITGKYTDFTKINKRRLEENKLTKEKYERILNKTKIFGAPYNIEYEDSNGNKQIKAEINMTDMDKHEEKALKFHEGITHIEFKHYIFNEYSSGIQEIVIPSTIQFIRNLDTDYFPKLKRITFNEGIEILDYSTIVGYNNTEVEIQLPKSLKYISRDCMKNLGIDKEQLDSSIVVI